MLQMSPAWPVRALLLGALMGQTVLLSSACRTTGASQAAGARDDGHAFTSAATAAGKELNGKYNNYPLQLDPGDAPVDCRTLIIPADPSVPFRGTALMLHGYTACPNQFYETATILAKKGISSFAPLLPGQGRAPVQSSDDKTINGVAVSDYYGEFLPSALHGGAGVYEAFVKDVNQFMATLPGPKFIYGLSVGGGLSTFAYLDQPGLYQRALLASPFYGAPGSYDGFDPTKQNDFSPAQRLVSTALYDIENTVLAYLAQNMEVVGHIPFGWGANCYKENAGEPGKMPRRGICDFHLEHLAAVIDLGNDILDRLKNLQPGTQLPVVQYVITEFDTGAGTQRMRQTAALQQLAAPSPQVNICANPHVLDHSFFARPDLYLVTTNPYWLNSYLQMSTDFIAAGVPFKLDSEPSLEVAYDAAAGKDTVTRLNRCKIYDVPYDTIMTIAM